MSDQEKLIYRNYLVDEGEKIDQYLSEQINKCEDVREQIKVQMRENRKLIQRYNEEQETFSNNMENKIKTLC